MRVGSTAHHIKSILSNGLAEKRVQIVKKMRNKASADNQDLYLCLLAYRNTVIDNLTHQHIFCLIEEVCIGLHRGSERLYDFTGTIQQID